METVFRWQIEQEKEFEFLDSIDSLEAYMKPDWSVYRIMDEIEEDHGREYADGEHTCIFNCITPQEFMSYIEKRYKGKYQFYKYVDFRVKNTHED